MAEKVFQMFQCFWGSPPPICRLFFRKIFHKIRPKKLRWTCLHLLKSCTTMLHQTKTYFNDVNLTCMSCFSKTHINRPTRQGLLRCRNNWNKRKTCTTWLHQTKSCLDDVNLTCISHFQKPI